MLFLFTSDSSKEEAFKLIAAIISPFLGSDILFLFSLLIQI